MLKLVTETPLVSFAIPELLEYPFLKHGIFPKQKDEQGEICAPDGASVLSALQGKAFCHVHQVHGTSLIQATSRTSKGQPADGLHTNEPLLSLHINHADCQAAIFYDPEKHVLANVHSGWRGLVGNIYAVTVRTMKKHYGCRPQDLIVAIAPSLGPDHAIYPDYQTLFPPSFFTSMPSENHMNFWEIARKQLLELGISKNHLFITEMCTYCEHETFFSCRYRGLEQHGIYIQPKKKQNNLTAAMLLPRE